MTQPVESTTTIENQDEFETPVMPALLAVLSSWLVFTVMFSFVPVSTWVGWTTIHWGARAFLAHGPLKTFLFFFAYWAVLHSILILPMTSGVYAQLGDKVGRLGRVAIATVMTSIPLLSLAYYLGHYREAMHFHEAFMAVVPSVLLGALIFEATRRASCFSLLTSLASFTSFFVWGDVLGPFVPVWTYAATGPGVYGLRLIALGAALLVAGGMLKKRPVSTETHLQHAKIILVALVAHLFFVAYAVPWITHKIQPTLPMVFMTRDISWLGYLAGIYFLWRRNIFSLRALRALALCEIGSLLLQIAFFAHRREASFLGLSQCLHWIVALLFFGWLLTFLRRPEAEAGFLRRSDLAMEGAA